MKNAQQYFHLVGGSASECDTIPGRQSMASAFFLYGQFEEVLVYLNSIRSFFINDDVFNYNYAQVSSQKIDSFNSLRYVKLSIQSKNQFLSTVGKSSERQLQGGRRAIQTHL